MKPKLLFKQVGKKKLYFLPYTKWSALYKDNYNGELQIAYPENGEKSEEEEIVEEILGDITSDETTEAAPSQQNNELTEVRKKEIIARTKYLEQKLIAKKQEIFEEWSERFFDVFKKSFMKLKNNFIELHLNEEQLNKLNENLDLAVKNLESTLDEIQNEYINEDDNIEETNK